MKAAIYCVSKSGYGIALEIAEKLYKDLDIYVSAKVYDLLHCENEKEKNIIKINGRLAETIADTFNRYSVHIFIMATGIVIRMIDGKLKSKDVDPAVLVIDEEANFVISLLSGHLGGANNECERVAAAVNALPVITTATDVSGKIAVDMISKKIKGKLADLKTAGRVTSLIVNEEKISLHLPKNIVDVNESSSGAIIISNRKTIEVSKVIPQNIILGIGCRRGVSKEKIIEKINYVMDKQNLEISSIRKIASAWVKSDEAGLLEAVEELKIPVEFISKEDILTVEHLVEEKSEFVKNEIGVYGVSEPCAYLASNKRGEFLVKKIKLEGITISIFEEEIINE